jgi:hypothetical protein
MRILLALALVSAAASTASAQQMREWSSRRRNPAPKEEPAPVALALNLTFSTTFWQEVQISTMGPVSDLSRLSKQGFYKLEIIQLLLMSHEGHQALGKTVAKRKKGAALADIAADYHLEYDKLYESALAVQEIVDKQYLPLFPEKRPKKEKEEW